MSDLPPEVLIDRNQILPDSSQPRKVFDEEAIKDLRDDIKANGLKEPIDINPLLDGRSTKYLTIDGECRTKATDGLEGYEQLPCRLYKYKSQREIDKHRASKHFHRKDWNPADRAVWLNYYMETHKLRQQDLAREFSVKQSTVSEWLAPTRDARVLKALRNEEIGFKQAVLLSRVDDRETRENALRDAIGKTQKQTEEIIAARYSEPETEKEEVSESEITDREALIASVPEDLQERLLDATKDLSLHDTERVVKQVIMGVRIDEAIRAVKLSRTPEIQVAEAEVKERFAQGDESQLPQVEGHSPSASKTPELPVNDGEGGSTEEALLSPETDDIVSQAFERGGEQGTEGEEEPERETCPTCNGNAYLKQGSSQVLCPNCGGKGFILKERPEEEATKDEAKDKTPSPTEPVFVRKVLKEFESIKKLSEPDERKVVSSLNSDDLKTAIRTSRKTGENWLCLSARLRSASNGETYEMSKLISTGPWIETITVEKIIASKEIENAKSTLTQMKNRIDENLDLLAKRGG